MLSSLVSILTAGTISSGDAQKLLEQCDSGASTAAMRLPPVLRLLLHAVFDPSRPPKPAMRDQLLRVLGRVAADAESVGYAAPATDDSQTRATKLIADLQEAQGICERNEVSEVGASVAALQRCADGAVVACGVLLWCHVNLTQPQYSGARFNASYLPDVLRLIMWIATKHTALRGEACRLLYACLTHEPPSDSETNALTTIALRRQLLDGMLLLLVQGSVFSVLSYLETWLGGADLSLVRHLLQQLVALAAPPFSDAFARRLLAMFRHPRTLEAHRSAEMKRPLVALVQQVGARMPDLAAEVGETLAALQVEAA